MQSAEAHQLQAILEGLTESLVVFDLGGDIVFVNRAAVTLYGLTEAETGGSVGALGDLFALYDPDGEPVENLESGLDVAIVAPDGETRRTLPLRAVYGEPGAYTSDVILSEPGVYRFEMGGFIGETEVDLNVPYGDEVTPVAELRFP